MILALNGATMNAQPQLWKVRGEAVVTCPCRVPCPCRTNARPSQPHCENLSYVRIVDGHYGAVKLDRLQYVWAADESLAAGQPKPTLLYFSKPATAAQIEAIEKIMAGDHCCRRKPGVPAETQVSPLPLQAGVRGSVYSARVGRTVRLDVDVAPGPQPMEPLPALDLWGNSVSYSRNITARIDDPAAGLKWDYSGLQANYRSFEAASDLLDQGKLLGLFRDDTGRFNERQRSLIGELGLAIPLSRQEFDQMLQQVRLPAKPVADVIGFDAHASIGGLIQDPGGNPRSGARLQLKPGGSGAVQRTIANPSGRYFFAHVPVGASELCASTWDGKTAMQSCGTVTVKPGQVANHDLRLSVRQELIH